MLQKKTASFMRSLCLGQIEEEILLPYPEPTTQEKETLSAVVASVIRPATLTGTVAAARMRRLSGVRQPGGISIGCTIHTADS